MLDLMLGGLDGRVTTRQHESNFRIHEGFGDFYVLLGDSRALSKASAKKDSGSVDVNAKAKKEPDNYEKAMDEYATVSTLRTCKPAQGFQSNPHLCMHCSPHLLHFNQSSATCSCAICLHHTTEVFPFFPRPGTISPSSTKEDRGHLCAKSYLFMLDCPLSKGRVVFSS